MLVAQDRPHAEVHERQPDGSWALRDASGLDAAVRLAAIGVELPLAEVYDRVTFPDSVAAPNGSR